MPRRPNARPAGVPTADLSRPPHHRRRPEPVCIPLAGALTNPSAPASAPSGRWAHDAAFPGAGRLTYAMVEYRHSVLTFRLRQDHACEAFLALLKQNAAVSANLPGERCGATRRAYDEKLRMPEGAG